MPETVFLPGTVVYVFVECTDYSSSGPEPKQYDTGKMMNISKNNLVLCLLNSRLLKYNGGLRTLSRGAVEMKCIFNTKI